MPESVSLRAAVNAAPGGGSKVGPLMIYYLVPAKFRAHSIDPFRQTWGTTICERLLPLTYHELFRATSLYPGILIFTHFEGVSPQERKLLHTLYIRMADSSAPFIALNNPGAALDRYELGLRLYEAGLNNFRPFYLDEDLSAVRFPVFIRFANEHGFWESGLLHDPGQLAESIEKLKSKAPDLQPREAIVVEFCDVAQGRVFRKYSALRMGDEIIPRHILFSSRWMTKYPELVDEAKIAEELEFVRNFPDADRLRPVFDLAGVDYGRIDYSFQDGQLRVWEINTNPVIVPPPAELHPGRMTSQAESANRILEAFERLDRRVEAGSPVRLWRWYERRRRRRARDAGKQFIRERDRLIARLPAIPDPPKQRA